MVTTFLPLFAPHFQAPPIFVHVTLRFFVLLHQFAVLPTLVVFAAILLPIVGAILPLVFFIFVLLAIVSLVFIFIVALVMLLFGLHFLWCSFPTYDCHCH